MAIKQSRRTVSISREVYDRLVAHREATGEPLSALVEHALAPVIAQVAPGPAKRDDDPST